MPDSRTKRTAAVIALLTAACSTATETSSDAGRPAIGLVAGTAHVDAGVRSGTPAGIDHEGPAGVATELVIDALTEQDLVATVLGTELLVHTPTAATVRVAAIHHTGQGHPHQSVYTVELEHAGGSWRSVGFSEHVT